MPLEAHSSKKLGGSHDARTPGRRLSMIEKVAAGNQGISRRVRLNQAARKLALKRLARKRSAKR